MHIPGCCKDLFGIGADGIDRAVMALNLSDGCEVVHVPHLEHSPPAGAEERGPPGNKRQSTHPILVRVWDLLRRIK